MEYIYIIDVKNEWFVDGERCNRNCPCHRVFKNENIATEYMQRVSNKVFDRIDDSMNPTLTTKRDNNGIVSISVEFKGGYDAIAGCDTFTTIEMRRVAINETLEDDPFDEILNEIYIG